MIDQCSVLLTHLGDVRDVVAVARACEEGGFRRVWLSETTGPDAGIAAAAVAVETSMAVGTAIVPTFTRSPAVLAMMASDLAALSGQTVALGVGAGGQKIVEDWHGLPYEQTVAHLVDTIAILRQALAGRSTEYRGEARSSVGFRLASPAPSVEVFVGAMGPRMRHAAARHADGLILSWQSPEATRRLAREWRDDLATAGRDPADVTLVSRAYAAVTADVGAVRQGVREELVGYLASPPYGRYFRWLGFGDDVDGVQAAVADGDRDASRAAVSDALLDGVLQVGDPVTVADRTLAYLEAGADDVMVQLVPSDRGGDPAATARALGQELQRRS